MAATTQFTIGADARCSDGMCGQASRVVVIDPVAQEVIHLVVEPKHRQGVGRLVPLSLIDATKDKITLDCDLAAFEKLDLVEETQFMPGSILLCDLWPGTDVVVALLRPGFGRWSRRGQHRVGCHL